MTVQGVWLFLCRCKECGCSCVGARSVAVLVSFQEVFLSFCQCKDCTRSFVDLWSVDDLASVKAVWLFLCQGTGFGFSCVSAVYVHRKQSLIVKTGVNISPTDSTGESCNTWTPTAGSSAVALPFCSLDQEMRNYLTNSFPKYSGGLEQPHHHHYWPHHTTTHWGKLAHCPNKPTLSGTALISASPQECMQLH